MKKLCTILCCLVMLSQNVMANCSDPSVWMETMNERVIKAVQGLGSNSEKAKIIQSIFQPNLDVELFTKKIIGRVYWMEASKEDRVKLKKNIYNVMLHDYTQAVVETLAKKPKVYRIRAGAESDQTLVTVLYHTQREKNLLAIFSLVCKEGNWKIYDISVQGVRLSDLQQSKYHKILSTSGIAGLNTFLVEAAHKRTKA